MNYNDIWEGLSGERPSKAGLVRIVPWSQFRDDALRATDTFVLDTVKSLHTGDVFVLKGAFPESWMRRLAYDVDFWWQQKPSEFHKMLEGSPDFHRIIDPETGAKYAFKGAKHSAYFYPWNNDPLNIMRTVYERWRLIKTVMGLECDAYENNTPKDGVVDRIQVVRYPPGVGFLETHTDPYLHQRLFISAYMSKRGKDFEGGGFYLIGQDGKKIEVEDVIDVGDMAIGYATLEHGVAPCNGTCDWSATDGRWFLSMYSNASDEVAQRHTGHAVEMAA